MVCMAAEGALAVRGGNWQVFDRMVHASGAVVKLNTTVTHVSKQADGTYSVQSQPAAAQAEPGMQSESTEVFDEIILAAPLQFSGLVIDPAPANVPDQIPYVSLHVTLFASPHRLSPAAFNLGPDEVPPEFILTTLPPGEHFGADPDGVGKPGVFSISAVARGLNPHSEPPGRPEFVYKIFSPKRVEPAFLARILGVAVAEGEEAAELPVDHVSWLHRKTWHSYPYEYPRVTFDAIQLDRGLWYTSGIESFISTMETSALMGKNVARLIVDGWEKDAGRRGRDRRGGRPPHAACGAACVRGCPEADSRGTVRLPGLAVSLLLDEWRYC